MSFFPSLETRYKENGSLLHQLHVIIFMITVAPDLLILKSIMEPFQSKRNKDGNVQAGTHLIIMDDTSCHGTISKSDPAILNYYRQFLIKGFD